MKILEKREKSNRVMVSIFSVQEGKKRRGSKSLTVLGTNVEEIYAIVLEALRKAQNI